MSSSVLELLAVNYADSTCKVNLLLCTVTDHDSLLDQHVIFCKIDGDLVLCSRNSHKLGFITKRRHIENYLCCRHCECEASVLSCHYTVCRSVNDDRHSYKREIRRVEYDTGQFPVLRKGIEAGCEKR